MENAQTEALLEQYKVYNYSKEKFISRSFAVNRFYTVLCMILLVTSYAFITFTPASLGVIIACVLGLLLSTLWWLNVDTYNALIKTKYQAVIDPLEEKLPASPFKDEFLAFKKLKSKKFNFLFSDVQKFFASFMFLVFLITLINQIWNFFKFFLPQPF